MSSNPQQQTAACFDEHTFTFVDATGLVHQWSVERWEADPDQWVGTQHGGDQFRVSAPDPTHLHVSARAGMLSARLDRSRRAPLLEAQLSNLPSLTEVCQQAQGCAYAVPSEGDGLGEGASLEQCRAHWAAAASELAFSSTTSDPRWSTPFPASCEAPNDRWRAPFRISWASLIEADDAARSSARAGEPTAQQCRAVFEHALDRTADRPIYLKGRRRACRHAARATAATRDVSEGDPRGPLRGACPGKRCGPRDGAVIIVAPEPEAGDACFGVWTYAGTGGHKQTLCSRDDGVHAQGSAVVY